MTAAAKIGCVRPNESSADPSKRRRPLLMLSVDFSTLLAASLQLKQKDIAIDNVDKPGEPGNFIQSIYMTDITNSTLIVNRLATSKTKIYMYTLL
jgi:hypothetical protein